MGGGRGRAQLISGRYFPLPLGDRFLPDTLLRRPKPKPHSRRSGWGTLGIRSQVAGIEPHNRGRTARIALNVGVHSTAARCIPLVLATLLLPLGPRAERQPVASRSCSLRSSSRSCSLRSPGRPGHGRAAVTRFAWSNQAAVGSQPARSASRSSLENISVKGDTTSIRFWSRLISNSSSQTDKVTTRPVSPARAVRPARCR